MAKTESTAVNELIGLVQGRASSPPPSEDDLFASMHPPRMTSTVPPLRGAGEVAPLPRGRAPQSTAEHSIFGTTGTAAAQAAVDDVMPRVRMRQASPARGTTIPPLSRRTAAAGTVAPPVRPSQATTAQAPRTSRPSGPPQPPPGRASSPSAGAIGRARASSPAPDAVARVLDPALPPLTRKSAAAGTLPPPSAPVAAPFESHDVDVTFSAAPMTASPFAMPVPLPVVTPPDMVEDHWYESRQSVGRLEREHNETRALIKKLIAPALLVIAAGIVIGAVIATGRQKHATPQKATPVAPTVRPRVPAPDEELVVRPSLPRAESENAATASAGAAEPQPPTKAEQAAQMAAAAANGITQDAPKAAVEALDKRAPAAVTDGTPAVREVQTKHGVVKFVDVRIDSDPAGATVTLVDGGKQSFLGSTPLSTSVEASRVYDVIVALDGRPTQMVHLDPATTSRLDVSLGRKSVASASPARRTSRAAIAPSMPVTSPSSDTSAEPASSDLAAEAVAKTGTLMVSSKPPCELVIDGASTGLTTPQRSIELASGSHEITFKNDAAGISKTVSVKITGGQVTKLIQDLMTQP